MAESGLQSRILKFMNSLPGCIAENVSGNANQSGRADINACYKGHALKIELKDPTTGYQPSKKQLLYLKKWKRAGAITGVCYNTQDVVELLCTIEGYDMRFKEGMTSKEKVEVLERYVLIHCILYYDLNESVISDKRYDKTAQVLARKIEKYGAKKIRKTQYGYIFYDFDGSTGFDLLDRMTEEDRQYLTQIAQNVLRLYKRDHNGKSRKS